jgi:hypothetical protein
MLNSVALVVRDVGRLVPYSYGATLTQPLILLIPRVLWPDKPINTFGQDFGRLFHVTNYWTRATYVDPTVPGELYWNFGLPGILVGMGLVGVLLRWLYRRYGAGPADPCDRAVHILILVQLSEPGGGLSSVVMTCARTVLLIALARWGARRLGLLTPAGEPSR